MEQLEHHDFYIFGHRHLILDMPISDSSTYLNIGEWISNSQYIEVSNTEVKSLKFDE